MEPRINQHSAKDIKEECDIYITDPPWGDAVHYGEITQFFTAWMRMNPPPPFDKWDWDGFREKEIKGTGDYFRIGMIKAYKAMTEHMPDNGIQIVMFNHSKADVWTNVIKIFWGAGLRVVADWLIATEGNSGLKKGNNLLGTHIIVCRKRLESLDGKSFKIFQEIKEESINQMANMEGVEGMFNESDFTTIGYTSMLKVLTKYTTIDDFSTIKTANNHTTNKQGVIDRVIRDCISIASNHT